MTAHPVPRRPHAWLPALVLSQGVVAFLWAWGGWKAGGAALLVSHAAFLWGSLRYDSALFGPVVRALDTTRPAVWLTIDDGPSDETVAMLDVLDRHAARATFFVVGERAAERPELLREIVRRGHDVGNHSHSHPEKLFWALGAARMRREIETAQATITAITGVQPRWFRAVVGMANPFVAAPLRSLGLARVAWSARGFDGVSGDPTKVVDRVERALRPGAIILMHEGAPHGRNVEMMEALLTRLDARDYECVLPSIVEPAS